MKTKKIITADDHPLLLKGLNNFLIEKNYNIIDSGYQRKRSFRINCKVKP